MKILCTILAALLCLQAVAQSKEDYYKTADAYYDQKDFKNALVNINLSLQQDSTNSKFLFLKANTLENLSQYEAAFDVYSDLIRLYPKNPWALSNRGLLLNKLQKSEYAIQDFDKALLLESPDSVKLSLYVNRGAAKVDIRDFEGAYKDFMAAYQYDSLSIGTLNNLASVCDEVGKGDKTLGYLFRIIKIDSTFIGAYGNIGFKYQEMGDYKTAIRYYDKVLALEPNDPLGFSNRAFNRYKLNDVQGALADINKSIELYPANSYAFKVRALIYLQQNKKSEACSDLNEALRLGFTKMYGDEVMELKKKICLSKAA